MFILNLHFCKTNVPYSFDLQNTMFREWNMEQNNLWKLLYSTQNSRKQNLQIFFVVNYLLFDLKIPFRNSSSKFSIFISIYGNYYLNITFYTYAIKLQPVPTAIGILADQPYTI